VIIDCHVHSSGLESTDSILRAMDQAGVEKMCLFSPYASAGNEVFGDGVFAGDQEGMEGAIDWLGKVVAQAPDRIIGFAWVDPRWPSAVQAAERAVDLGIRGIKSIPNHWYPTDECALSLFAKMDELGMPGIFHSGILFGFGDSSRFCRPVFYEALINTPGVKFALSHISWPWVDECLAVAGRFRAATRANAREMQMFVDLTPGTPRIWRADALRKALVYLGDGQLIYGSDTYPADDGERLRASVERDQATFRQELGLSSAAIERIMSGNLLRMLGED
jgi:predicted TIM-barrel fold metal-dependent hydrolase